MKTPRKYKGFIYVPDQLNTTLVTEEVTHIQIVQQCGVSVQGIANPF
jgi:hypothetical protein